MTKKISVIFTGVAVAALFWYLVGEVFILKNNENSISKLQCVSYAPFSKEQSPFDTQMVISQERVREDLALLSKYTECIRTYSTVGLEAIPKIARENGMKMLMGAWVSSDKLSTELELKTLIKLAKQNQDIVKAVIVGNEVLLRGDTTDKILAGYIKDVKKALPNTQVTYADVWEFWLKYPEIQKATDFVTIHILPYWEDDPMNINSSIEHLAKVREEVEAILKDKNILIGETGWPSEGRVREDAVPSKINQAVFVREFVKLAEEKGWSYNIIEAFDQPWKRVNEGAVGGFWGLFDKNRMDKNIFNGLVSNFANYKLLALGSIFLVLAFSFMLKNLHVGKKEMIYFGVANTFFAILFMLQVEQYSVTIRTALEFLWAAIVLITHLGIYYFLLYYIVQNKKPQAVNIEKILKQKILNFDTSLMILFYSSFVLVLISNLALAFDGRYRNFEMYMYIISVVSFVWLYKEEFENMNFGKFEKASFLILALSSLAIFVNETYLNIYSDIWILISLGFAYILYRGSRKTAYSELKSLALYMILFFAFFASIRYGIFSNSYFAQKCNTSLGSLVCEIRSALGISVHYQTFGLVAVFSAAAAFFANKKTLSLLALFFSIGAILMFNTLLGCVAFVLSLYLLTKEREII